MNPARTQSGMTVNALLQMGMIISVAIAVICIAILAAVSTPLNTGTSATFFLVAVACAIIAVLGIITTNHLIQRRLREQMNVLANVCRDYVGGERSVRAPVNGDDDFAMLSMQLNNLLDSQGNTPGAGGGSFSGGDAATLQAQIEKLLQEVSAVGDGDLRVQAEVTPDTLGVLADSFNYMIEELAKVVGRVQTTAVQVTNSTRRILDRSAELAQASETQVDQISQTTEAVEALASFIQQAAHDAQLCVEVAQEALQNASSGQGAVRQTIEGMMQIRENVQETSKKIKRLGERSNEISEIVRIIDDISDQTNLLALNAAIQSAMAGEHGRGFAVVADEIRQLAERSTESTKRIATLIKSIQGDTYEAVVAMEESTQEVVKGSQLADDAGRALNSIYSAVERQTQMIENIAQAANQQTSVSEAVAVAMGQISEITRQTNEGTQDAAVSVSYLADLAEQLRSSVSTFRLPDRGNETANSFSPMTAVTEMPYGNGNSNQLLAPLGNGMDSDWGQRFSGNFPPLPEPGNSGSLVALPSRSSGQYNYQPDFAAPAGFGGFPQAQQQPQSQSLGQPNFGNQAYYQEQGQGYNGQQFTGTQNNFANGNGVQQFGGGGTQNFANGNGAQQFGGQFDFGDMNGFNNQPDFNGQQYDMTGNQGQPVYQQRMPASPNMGNVPASPQPGQALPSRPRRLPAQSNNQNQGQPSFNQDQFPFQNNG